MKPALVILAAGASRRLGQCKALVEWRGRTTLERLSEAARVLDGAPPLVVTGADHERIAARAPRGVELAHNLGWERGRLGSVLVAQRLREGLALCIAPVDVPLVDAPVFELLARRWAELGAPGHGWLAPRSPSAPVRFGHPLVLGPALAARAHELAATSELRALRSWAAPLESVACSSAAIFDDLDTPEDLARLRERECARA